MKILTFSSLYPSEHRPRFGIFVQSRLLKLLEADGVQATVIAPVPWFPFDFKIFKQWADFNRVAAIEELAGVQVLHPRYIVIPKIGMILTPFLLALSGIFCVWRLRRQGSDFDVIDAHYFYPDGVAAAIIGKFFGRPVIITARGSDINVISEHWVPKKMIQWAMRHAALNIGVSDALCKKMVGLGCYPDRVITARNGVDLEKFKPTIGSQIRNQYYVPDTFTILSIGNLIASKGHDLVIKAMSMLPGSSLLIVGRGSERQALELLIKELQLEERVKIQDEIAQSELPVVYSNADVLVLASSREGLPNVVLEAMACGTPVVVTEVGGIPEVVVEPLVGYFTEKNVIAIRDAIVKVQRNPPARANIRAHAAQFGWAQTIDKLHNAFRDVVQCDVNQCSS